MKLKKIRAIILCLLIIGSIYQIIMLWFDNVSDRNFFYSFLDNNRATIKQSKIEIDNQHMIRPYQVGIFLGASDKDFTVINKDDGYFNYHNIYPECIKVIVKAINKGTFNEAENKDLWEDRGIIFNLPVALSGNIIGTDLNVTKSNLEELLSIKSIIITPANEKNNFLRIFLIDNITNEAYKFSIMGDEVRESNQLLNDFITKAEDKNMPLYISTLKNEIDLFRGNILLPLASENMQYNSNLKFSIPFIYNNEFQKDELERYINNFFSNPNVKWTKENNDVMIYGDDNALVKYNKNGLLDYSSIINKQSTNQNISNNYNVSERFLQMDKLFIEQDYYLSEFVEEENRITFYYEYSMNGFPIIIESSLLSSNNMKYPVEVTVEKGKVTKYRRLILDIKSAGNEETLSSQFEVYLNEFVNYNNIKKEQLEDMYLSYVKDGEMAKIMWIIKFQGELYELE